MNEIAIWDASQERYNVFVGSTVLFLILNSINILIALNLRFNWSSQTKSVEALHMFLIFAVRAANPGI